MIRPKTKAGLERIVENWAWGGRGWRLSNIGGAQIFFQPTLMEFFFFAKAEAPPSHYVAPPLDPFQPF